MVIVDTNVLVDVLEDDPDWADWSIGRMRELSKIHEFAINPVVYAELSLTFDAVEDMDAVITDLNSSSWSFRVPPCSWRARRSSAIAYREGSRPTC